ncbi:hypothetical protein F5Y19DRAFT_482298 [Xylariaceae sp. FL1651]|nr:hypothetical protein F5Y19DRAFT_482298 [Xylariaceae sp. FL1651]
MASTYASEDIDTDPQPQLSVAIGGTGPARKSQPTHVVSHLDSLQDPEEPAPALALSNAYGERLDDLSLSKARAGLKTMAAKAPYSNPDNNKDIKQPEAFSLYWEGLELITKQPCLLRFHSSVLAEAIRRSKKRALKSKVQNLLASARHEDLLDALGHTDTIFILTEYIDEVEFVTKVFFGLDSKDENDQPVPAQLITADTAEVRARILDRFVLASILLQNIILRPDMLPHESICTFYVNLT